MSGPVDLAALVRIDSAIADLARAYGEAYSDWVLARRDSGSDITEATMNYIAAERALRAAVCPGALATEEVLP